MSGGSGSAGAAGAVGAVETGDAVTGEGRLRWIDHHCHLDPPTADAAVAEAHATGVERLVVVGTDVASSLEAVSVASRHAGLRATAGVHPHEARLGLDGLTEVLAEPRVVAVGECGLDYHYDHSPRDVQRRVFAAQIGLANEMGLPIVVHSREAWDDTFAVLDAEGPPERVVFHCFTGGPAEAEGVLERGGHLSFSGIVSFPGAEDLREAARRCPADRMLVETDSPFLAPVPNRGRRNRPAWVVHVGEALARARGEPVSAVAAATWRNAAAFYGWS